ncbi:MAG: esterase/lipase family protein [Candidatus Rokuibacteriota bacterium]
MARLWLAVAGAAVTSIAIQEYATRRYYRTMPPPEQFFDEVERTAWTPAWREALWPAQWLALQRSAVYRGDGVPRGAGEAVLLVPGFLTAGGYLATLRAWLDRIGYRARVADIGWNVDCFDVHNDRLVAAIQQARLESGGPVHLVGHSLGGILARAAATRSLDLVASVAALNSPFRGLRVHPALRAVNSLVRTAIRRKRPEVPAECHTFACGCATVRSLAAPLPASLPQLAIVTRSDGLADWRYAADPETTRVVEVPATHLDTVFSPLAYEALAAHLASARTA